MAVRATNVAAGASANRIPIDAHPLFAGVDVEELLRAAPRLRSRLVQPNALVCGPQHGPGIVLVLSGTLLAFNLAPDGGQRLILEVLGPGDTDGMLRAAGLEPHMCEALTAAEIVAVSKEDLDQLTTLNPQVAQNLYLIAIRRLERREAQIAAMSQHSSVRAVARQLLSLAAYAGTRAGPSTAILRPRPKHQLLADMLGLRRETVSLTLNRLRSLGAVGLGPNQMWIDERRLMRLLGSSESFHKPRQAMSRIA